MINHKSTLTDILRNVYFLFFLNEYTQYCSFIV